MILNIFTLNGFLVICFILLLLVSFLYFKRTDMAEKPYACFFVLGISLLFSYLTFVNYSKSHGNYYQNADYHIIQQDGFRYPNGQTLLLASDQTPDSALLATGVGELWLDPSLNLHAENFRLPLYIEESKDNFRVVNLQRELALNDGDEIMAVMTHRSSPSDTLFTIKYEEVWERTTKFFFFTKERVKYRFVFSLSGSLSDEVTESIFRQGMSLTSILQKGAATRPNPMEMALLENCYLVREHYKLDDKSKKKALSAPVYLFIDDKLNNDSCHFFVNHHPVAIEHNVITTPVSGKQLYYGLGMSKSLVYRVNQDEDGVFLEYRLPRMYHFPEFEESGETKMYLTTDLNDVIDHRNEYKSFYQFTEQLSPNNIYKASAVLAFNNDHSGVSLSPIYADRYDEEKIAAENVTIGKRFNVKTASCGGTSNMAQVSYVFKIRDMRDNEVYRKAKYLYWAILLVLAFIFFMIAKLKPINERQCNVNKQYLLETSIYLVLIAFMTVRLVLLWRLHAFPPVENVSYLEFQDLTNGSIFTYTFWCVVGVLGLRLLVLVVWRYFWRKRAIGFTKWITSFFNWLKTNKKGQNRKNLKIWDFSMPLLWLVAAVVIPVMSYLLCLALGKSDMIAVAVKEAVTPLVAFAINSVFYILRQSSPKTGNRTDGLVHRNYGIFCWTAIVLNTGLFFLYLYIVNELGLLFPMLAVFGFWFIIAVLLSDDKAWWKAVVTVVVVVFVMPIVFCHVSLAQKPLGEKALRAVPSRIRDRIETLAYTPTEMMQKALLTQNDTVKFKDKSMQDILNASSNKWFIDNHLLQRRFLENQPGFKEEYHHGFVLDKEYNQLAVSYKVQTRDVLLLRYIIYEHGRWVVRLLLLLLLSLTVIVFAVFRRKADSGRQLPLLQQLPLQATLYLFLFSVYLYLVNINAVAFVGLDFPFLTLTSKVAPLGLLLPLLGILLTVNMRQINDSFIPDHDDCSDRRELDRFRDARRVKTISGIVATLIIAIFIFIPLRRQSSMLRSQTEPNSFSVSMEPLADFVNNYLNPVLKEYQNEGNTEGKALSKMSVSNKNLKGELQKFLGGFDETGSRFETALSNFNRLSKHQHEFDPFIRSAFQYFMKTSLVDVYNILHVKKSDGKFVFVTNKVYYEMRPIFNNGSLKEWNGDLLAAAGVSRMNFEGENGKPRPIQSVDHLSVQGEEVANQAYFCNANNDASFYLYQIPAHYCYNEDRDVFVMVCNTGIEDDFKLDPHDDPTSRFSEKMGIRVLPNDVVKVGNAKQSFSLVTENNHYFSKRIHYNGKHQVIYPLGNRFMFAYNFDQMLAENYHPVDSLAEKPVRISLDYDLLCDVQGYCDSVIRADDRIQRKAKLPLRFGEGITVTAVDGNGRIRLLADCNPHKSISTDPNQIKEVRKLMDSIYLNGDDALERSLLQNRNIARMPIGPGSTIKVPFYVALMSQVDIPWENVELSFHPSLYERVTNEGGKDRDLVHYFGPDEIKRKHGMGDKLGWDEIAGEYTKNLVDPNKPNVKSILGPSDFIATSNNFYYGSVLMLGNYDADKLNGGLGSVLDQSSLDEKVFPKFTMVQQNQRVYYKFKTDFLKELSGGQIGFALDQGLYKVFRFNETRKADNLISFYDRRPVEKLLDLPKNDGYTNMNALYVYSTLPSYYNFIQQKNVSVKKQDIYVDHFNLTSGGVQQMDVSPLNMAEMYLRVALQDGSAEQLLTYQDDADSVCFSPMSDINSFQDRMRSVTYNGMWNAINQSKWRVRGTLSGCVSDSLANELSAEGIFLYGKTGTAGIVGQANNNYHYAFILSNHNLHQNNYDPTDLKIYVVYFGYYNGTLGHSGTKKTRDEIIRKIIHSETFRDYWYGTNSIVANN